MLMSHPKFLLKKHLLAGLFCAVAASLAGQDLYDFAHSRRYARYLLQSRQYDLAAEEYERLIFAQPTNDTLRLDLLRAYRRGGLAGRGLEKWSLWQAENFQPGLSLRTEHARLLLAGGQPGEARKMAAAPGILEENFVRRAHFFGLLLEQNWRQARDTLAAFPADEKLPRCPDFEKLLERGMAARRKSPAVAAGLSLVLPGAGKAYAGQWKDGIISLVFVGVNVWQTVRRFDKEGTDTFWGWVHGGLGLGFYIGNVYGSHKAARKSNALQRLRLQRETENLVFPVLD